MTIHVQVQFFARFRETLGTESENIEGDFATVDAVRQYLLQRGGVWEVLSEQSIMCARNQELCSLDEPVKPGVLSDRYRRLSMAIRVQAAAFDPGVEVNAMHDANVGVGAVVSFVGYVRDFNDGRDVSGMFLEHYPGMTEKALGKIVDEAQQRWPLLKVEVLHRVGALEPGEPIVFVGVASAHRQAAFETCDFVMDYLKTRAPFWKKENTSEGPRWVEGRESDHQAADRWK